MTMFMTSDTASKSFFTFRGKFCSVFRPPPRDKMGGEFLRAKYIFSSTASLDGERGREREYIGQIQYTRECTNLYIKSRGRGRERERERGRERGREGGNREREREKAGEPKMNIWGLMQVCNKRPLLSFSYSILICSLSLRTLYSQEVQPWLPYDMQHNLLKSIKCLKTYYCKKNLQRQFRKEILVFDKVIN